MQISISLIPAKAKRGAGFPPGWVLPPERCGESKSHILFAKATKKSPLLRTCFLQHSGQSAAQCRDICRSAGISILPGIMPLQENRSNSSLSPSDAYLKTAEFMNFSNYAFILLPAFTIQNHRLNPYTGFYRFDEYVLVRKFSAFLQSPSLALRHFIYCATPCFNNQYLYASLYCQGFFSV